ncbi:HAMP domain-containing histidine kinase [Sphingomonas sp. 2R-10]|uniref:sensor histidine kinase n=1 Tax=Sphingomonas sp. 2R-10 TaxID=3045148 RepID=UPI000F7B01AF|nr:histidine kinase dimerization/phospho-acceptor domain-containing protein [Sphingomonas sp. 2R-10]MDJ0275754.1 HAMP domain-containing histidine kinase [Sphingomonas sp. 2R-10]
MRFDDTLETVLASDLTGEGARASAWRQLVDLIGRGRALPDPRAIALLHDLRDGVPRTVRVASARDLEYARPPAVLVDLIATDVIEAALPVLRSATLSAGEWLALLPRLTPAARGVVRNRRDIDPAVQRALDSFGSTDLVLGDDRESVDAAPADNAGPVETPAFAGVTQVDGGSGDVEETAEPASTFIDPDTTLATTEPDQDRHPSEGWGLSQQANDASPTETPAFAGVTPVADTPLADAPAANDEPEPADPAGPFSITDVMARIEAFERTQDVAPPPPLARHDSFRFETDATGILRWVDGVSRAPLIGLSLDFGAAPGHARFDGIAAGALRQRSPFRDARLVIGGDSDAAGEWCVSGVPAFDHATGRFTGYRGTGRRPRRDERAEPAPHRDAGVAQLRQLVHELRTPAGAIAGFAEMIEAQLLGPVPPVYRDRAGAILDHSRELVAVIDDLDLAARIDGDALDLRADSVALRPVFDVIAGDLASLCALRGTLLEIEPTDLSVTGDRRAVERLLARLLATLVSAGEAEESIYVRMGLEGDGHVAIVLDRPQALDAWPGDSVFDVDDDEQDQSLLGTGFALRLARNLASELGGTLVFGSATLTLRLPAAEAEVGQALSR